MAILRLEVRYTHKQKKYYPPEYYSYCPEPQMNQNCKGIFVKTRIDQIECVACMHLHKTIHLHPFIPELLPPPEIYDDCGILTV